MHTNAMKDLPELQLSNLIYLLSYHPDFNDAREDGVDLHDIKGKGVMRFGYGGI